MVCCCHEPRSVYLQIFQVSRGTPVIHLGGMRQDKEAM